MPNPQPTDPRETFKTVMKASFKRFGIKWPKGSKGEYDESVAKVDILAAADIYAAAKAEKELANFWHELPPYKSELTAASAYALFCNRIAALPKEKP